MLGFDSGARGLVTAVKEAVDNALDATEEAGVLPDIYIEIEEVGDYYRLVIEDNGPGITKTAAPESVREAPVRESFPRPRAVSRSTGNRDFGGRAVLAAHVRPAREDHLAPQGAVPGAVLRADHRHRHERAGDQGGRGDDVGPPPRHPHRTGDGGEHAPATSSTTT